MLKILSDSKVCKSYSNSYSNTFENSNGGAFARLRKNLAKNSTSRTGPCHHPVLEVYLRARRLVGPQDPLVPGCGTTRYQRGTSSTGPCHHPVLELCPYKYQHFFPGSSHDPGEEALAPPGCRRRPRARLSARAAASVPPSTRRRLRASSSLACEHPCPHPCRRHRTCPPPCLAAGGTYSSTPCPPPCLAAGGYFVIQDFTQQFRILGLSKIQDFQELEKFRIFRTQKNLGFLGLRKIQDFQDFFNLSILGLSIFSLGIGLETQQFQHFLFRVSIIFLVFTSKHQYNQKYC